MDVPTPFYGPQILSFFYSEFIGSVVDTKNIKTWFFKMPTNNQRDELVVSFQKSLSSLPSHPTSHLPSFHFETGSCYVAQANFKLLSPKCWGRQNSQAM